MKFTLSVRSFQVAKPRPSPGAWPPSLPSVPSSRASRVTSEANDPSWPTMVFTTLPMRRNSPRRGRSSFSRSMVWDRSPLATAPITRAISAVGWTMSAMRVLTASTLAAQEPWAAGNRARWLILPWRPTVSPSRSNSLVMRSLSSTTSLNASASSPATPLRPRGIRTEKSPRRKALSAARSSAVSPADPSGPRAFFWPLDLDLAATETVAVISSPKERPLHKGDASLRPERAKRRQARNTSTPPAGRTVKLGGRFPSEIKNLGDSRSLRQPSLFTASAQLKSQA